jgi:hypothetical protein
LTNYVGYDKLPFHERCICIFHSILFHVAYFISFKETSLGASFLEHYRKHPSNALYSYLIKLCTTCLINVVFLHVYIIKFVSCIEVNIHSGYSSVGRETSLKIGNRGYLFPSPAGARDFSFFCVSASLLGTTQTSSSG